MDGHRHHGRALLTRAIAPGLALLAVIVGIGLLLTPPGLVIPTSEASVSQRLAQARTDTWNDVTLVWSLFGSTGMIVAVGLVVSGLILFVTRNRRLAAVPVLASLVQEAVFLLAANIVDRPRPPVGQLDVAPPTASYPSGHVGASAALYFTFALLALRIRIVWVRWFTFVVCLAIPPLVAFGRVYRGMHHLTDVAVGLLNGTTCALLALWWFRSQHDGLKTRRPRVGSPRSPSAAQASASATP